jgi:hypothetical protein
LRFRPPPNPLAYMQVCAALLVIEAILAVQTLCVVDMMCFAGGRGDPAIPTGHGRVVVPVALLTALVVAPLTYYSTSPSASSWTRLLTGLVTVRTFINAEFLIHPCAVPLCAVWHTQVAPRKHVPLTP